MVDIPKPTFRPRCLSKDEDRGGDFMVGIKVDDRLREEIDRALLDHGVSGRASFVRQCVTFALFHIDAPLEAVGR